MTANGDRVRFKRRWEKDPHCFWCGCLTVWREKPREAGLPDTATLDHIRSRYCTNRQNGFGIWVLACSRCNNERCQMEQLWLSHTNVATLQERSGSRKAPKSFRRAQANLCAAVCGFVRCGGQFVGEASSVKELLRVVKRYETELASSKSTRAGCLGGPYKPLMPGSTPGRATSA